MSFLIEGAKLSRTSAALIFAFGLCIAAARSQNSISPELYSDDEAYKIYSLLLPHESALWRRVVMIQQETVAITMPCLTPSARKRFVGALVAFNGLQGKKYLLQPKFQLDKPYKLIRPGAIRALPSEAQNAASYVEMSPIGFNRDKTRAILFMGSPCGGLCGSWTYHLLEKVNGKWKEVPGVNCMINS